jgi:hypothetical protein
MYRRHKLLDLIYKIIANIDIHVALQQNQKSLAIMKADCSNCGILPHVICMFRTEECDLVAWQDGMSL